MSKEKLKEAKLRVAELKKKAVFNEENAKELIDSLDRISSLEHTIKKDEEEIKSGEKVFKNFEASPIQIKVINEIVESCWDCPYHSYDSHYSMSTDSGYDCDNAGKRIIDDYESSAIHKAGKKIPIPIWCPLPNAIGIIK